MKLNMIIFYSLLFLTNLTFSQSELEIPPIQNKDGVEDFIYLEIASFDSSSSLNITYSNLKRSIISNNGFKSLVLDDSSNFTLVAKLYFRLPEENKNSAYHNDKIHYKITVSLKPGKYKYTIEDIIWTYSRTVYTPQSSVSSDHEDPLIKFHPKNFKGKRKESAYKTLNRIHNQFLKEIKIIKNSIENKSDW